MRRRALDLCRMIARKWARAASLALAALICAALAVSGLMGEAWGLGAPGSPAKSGGGATASKPNQTSTFANYFQYSPVQVAYKAPAYALPLKAIDISNFDQVTALGLGTDAQALLLKNGFVATSFTPSPDCADVVEAYKMLARGQVPVLVTSGSLFHTYHVLFDYTLSTIESGQLYGNIWAVSLGLFTKSYDAYRNSSGDAKEAALRDAAYLAVGLSLLMPEESPGGQPSGEPEGPGARGVRSPRISPGPGGSEGGPGEGREFTDQDRATYRFEVPAELAAQVRAELDLIAKHQSLTPSPLFKYEEDYSQYVPRGHYNMSKKLQHYFRAMMWFGRMSMLLKGSSAISSGATCSTCDALLSTYDAKIQTLGACLLAAFMAGDTELLSTWEKAYKVTAFFVGFSDDLGPYEYIDAVNAVFGGSFAPALFDAKQGALKAKLAEYSAPRIYGGTGNCTIPPPFTPAQAESCLAKTRGFRLMGQRYVPDSYLMSKLVAPYVGSFTGSGQSFTCFNVPGVGPSRVFPRGLDVMALLGSDRALPILGDLGDSHYDGYDAAVAKLRQELGGLDARAWHQNLYWTWLWVLKSLLAQHGTGYPTFMQGDAWQDRLLTQALASWTELRHDTILYVKQSYTMTLSAVMVREEKPKVLGYVEPVPEVYNRLLALSGMLRKGLSDMGCLAPGEVSRYSGLEAMLGQLAAISSAELKGDDLKPDDLDYIVNFGEALESVLDGLDALSRKTTMVADVHTDTNSGKVLEEACGRVGMLVAAVRTASGTYLAVGPELTYFEFKQPMDNRLTDEAWREMPTTNAPAPPEWTASYSAEGR